MALKKIQTRTYLMIEEQHPDEIAGRLNQAFREYAIASTEDQRKLTSGRPLGSGGSDFVRHKFQFAQPVLRFSFSYRQSSVGSLYSEHDYKDISGNLTYSEGLEQDTLDQLDSLLESAGLSTRGTIGEVLYQTRKIQKNQEECFQQKPAVFSRDLKDLIGR